MFTKFFRFFPLLGMSMFLLFLLNPLTSHASEDSSDPIRVAAFPMKNFYNIAEDGTVTGYDVDMLNEIARQAGREIEFVPVVNWNTGLDMVNNHELDILGSVFDLEERHASYLYSSYPSGETYTVLLAKSSRTDLVFEDFDNLKDLTIGCDIYYGGLENVKNFYKSYGFENDIVYYEGLAALRSALDAGEIDAMFMSALSMEEDEKMLARFDPRSFYYITTPDNSELMESINMAMMHLKLSRPDFESNLLALYYPALTQVPFSLPELEYIAASHPVKVACPTYLTPISYINPSDPDTVLGIYPALLDKISQISGLNFTYIPVDSPEELSQMVNEKKADLSFCTTSSISSPLSDSTFSYTNAFLPSNSVIITTAKTSLNYDSAQTVVVPSCCFTTMNIAKELFPQATFLTADTPVACLKALDKKQADVCLMNIYMYNSLPDTQDYVQYVTQNISYTYLFSDPENRMLINILNKSLEKISETELNSLISSNLSFKPDGFNLRLWIKYNPLPASLLTAGITFLLTCIGFQHFISLKNRQRNKELTEMNQQLTEAVYRADEANKAKTMFLSKMSHEIRNPLNAIIGMTKLAQYNQKDTGRIDSCLKEISFSSEYLLSLVNDILDLSKIESNKIVLSSQTFVLSDFCEEIHVLFENQALSKQIRFFILQDCEDYSVIADRLRLKQVIINLLGNAMKFTNKNGTVSLKVEETAPVKDNLTALKFSVSDTGIGISQEDLSHIFENFTQGKRTMSSNNGGTGLGLPISQNLVQLMGGTIEVTSIPNEGSCFFFTLHLPTAPLPSAFTAPVVTPDISKTEIPQLSGHQILVVEDNVVNRELATELIKMTGATVLSAVDGADALRQFEASKPGQISIIFMDIRMPNMNGLEATKAIRALQRSDSHSVNIIALTADVLSNTEESMAETGFTSYLYKPIDVKKLYQLLKELLTT